MTTLNDVKWIDFPIHRENGILVPIESYNLPFRIKRAFFVHGVKDSDPRGQHAHYETKQVLICIKGVMYCTVDDGKDRTRLEMSSPDKGLYIPEMVWDEQTYYTNDTVLLVLSSTNYDKDDYITDYKEFECLKSQSSEG